MKPNESLFLPGHISDKKQFFQNIIEHFIHLEPELQIWGKLPETTWCEIKLYEKPAPFWRKIFFREKSILLTPQNHIKIISQLTSNDVLEKISWGLIKNKTALILCASWDGNITISESKYSPRTVNKNLMQNLTSKGVIKDYEEISSDE